MSFVLDENLDAGNPPSRDAGLFGANVSCEDASLVLIPVPWEATTSYGRGTAQGPMAVLKASHQLDLFDPVFGEPYRLGIHLMAEDAKVKALNLKASHAAQGVIEAFESGVEPSSDQIHFVNQCSREVNEFVFSQSQKLLNQKKLVGVLGGDHSSPFGLIKALASQMGSFDILHIDAHLDLRKAYEGFEDSHASIMYNVMEKIPQIGRLVQVGQRDYSKDEFRYAEAQSKITTYYDRDLHRLMAQGQTFGEITRQIVSQLGEAVYISFDIDGLDPSLCPHTGTPVPGGLRFAEALYLIEELVLSGRRVVGFDLCEVAPQSTAAQVAGDLTHGEVFQKTSESEWDANVGARILYKLCAAILWPKVKS